MSRIVILNPSPFSRVCSNIAAIASSLSWISPAPVTHQTTFGETYFLVAALKPCVDMHPMNSWMNCSLAFDIVTSHLRAPTRIRRPDIQPTQHESRRDRYRSTIFPEAWGDRISYASIRRYWRHSPRRASPLPRCPPPILPNG